MTVTGPGFSVSVKLAGGGVFGAVTLIWMLWPAASEPLIGLTISPAGTVIVNVTGPPDAVSVKLPVNGAPPFGDGVSVIVVADGTSVPGGGRVGVGVGVGVRVGVGVCVGVGVRVGVGAPVGVGVRVGVLGGDPPGVLAAAPGDGVPGVREREEAGAGETPVDAGGPRVTEGGCVDVLCAALADPPPFSSASAAAAPPAARMRTAAAA